MAIEPAIDELIAEIERGLEGVTPGPWFIYDGCSWRRIGTSQTNDCAVLAPTVAIDGHPDLTSRNGDLYRNLGHIARCSPDNIAALIARMRQAEAERDEERSAANALLSQNEDLRDAWANVKSERDQALAHIKVMDEALAWYDTNVALCKGHGEAAIDARLVLIRDGGARARAARKEPADGNDHTL